jgi:hypothetical protein
MGLHRCFVALDLPPLVRLALAGQRGVQAPPWGLEPGSVATGVTAMKDNGFAPGVAFPWAGLEIGGCEPGGLQGRGGPRGAVPGAVRPTRSRVGSGRGCSTGPVSVRTANDADGAAPRRRARPGSHTEPTRRKAARGLASRAAGRSVPAYSRSGLRIYHPPTSAPSPPTQGARERQVTRAIGAWIG